jgi:hypothetical protein
MSEPDITINGYKLTEAQAMTLRVALGSFAMSLSDLDSLGTDATGRGICRGYKARIKEISDMFQRTVK